MIFRAWSLNDVWYVHERKMYANDVHVETWYCDDEKICDMTYLDYVDMRDEFDANGVCYHHFLLLWGWSTSKLFFD